MHACIHAATPKMHLNLLAVLGGLHSQKKARTGEKPPGGEGGIGVKGVGGGEWRGGYGRAGEREDGGEGGGCVLKMAAFCR